MTKTFNIQAVIDLLRKADFDYEYCSPERVEESDMTAYTSQICQTISESTDEELKKVIEKSITEQDFEVANSLMESEGGTIEENILLAIGSELAHHFVKDFIYTTVTFKIYF